MREVKPAHVHLHELALAARWYGEALLGAGAHAPSVQLQVFRSILRRAAGARG